ncbi:MAG: hypothetical protein WC728_15090 [Elusimicrobiota bacterium]
MFSRLAAFLATSLVLFLAVAGVSRLYGSLLRAPWTRLAPPAPKAKPIRAALMPPEPHAERAGRSQVYDDAFLEPVFHKRATTPEPVQTTDLSDVAQREPAPEEEPKPKPKPKPAVRRSLNKISLEGAAGYPMKRFVPAVMDGTEPGRSPAPQVQQQAPQLQPVQAVEPQGEAPSSAPAPAKRALTSITRPIGGVVRPVQQQTLAPEVEQPAEPAPAEEGE